MVVLTGGEPTLQNLRPLIVYLKRDGWYVAIETNGTNMKAIPTIIDWVTVSPKVGVKYEGVIYCDEVKVVLDGKADPERARESIRAKHYYIQPCSENFEPAIRFVKENPEWRLSIQTQKLIDIR